ncbi:TRAP dicarboxylate transporter, DctQ subunit (plasmid) [Ruegeria pomeroyi DSS-3]|uniref:TRAP transporter small permease protein n=2 Tax=Ruegeria pomeroyi TaxID=89184 RepID=Q5LKK9_RUEPO|nr:TRAP transporter small permease [Ruegeria pomeroyi]AAV97504.1 TRAP dicarboxylate transporter, DctQ subunit [Ruegeria pomeroyi DSS-3]NVK97838.1 TRAP transporter small permease [Ruegeria pomeroyi]NVL01364.1 TRAP transporter small permease [Ruegeria pomeroyi]HCE71030.1 TRAP transporter small permease [Ruegeria sp.]
MLTITRLVDRAIRMILTAFCAVLLLMMVAFTVYTVVMRYVFENPPVWGDLLTVLSNIWLVFFALALTVRDKDHIALDLIYTRLPLKWAFLVQQFWTLVIFALGLVMIIWGVEAVTTMGGKYWEMWYFAWEDGKLVFKPNYMPKKYAVAIVPISGFLVSLAAIASMLEDSARLRAGTYDPAKGLDSGG